MMWYTVIVPLMRGITHTRRNSHAAQIKKTWRNNPQSYLQVLEEGGQPPGEPVPRPPPSRNPSSASLGRGRGRRRRGGEPAFVGGGGLGLAVVAPEHVGPA